MDDQQITDKAIKQAKAMKKVIARKLVDHLPEEEEAARAMVRAFKNEHDLTLVHIENDELRKEFEDYQGYNSPLFQRPATILVEAGDNKRPHFNVSDIDALLRKKYTRESLERIVGITRGGSHAEQA
ncbi:hypothetical protein [Salinivibrio kushneri]|uniref:hypothetical protein n=1 Tax=Salinivibrio kushneri TaxID=1908198 RepID=UPI000987A980|nr:hypothetical protein [Salinivibrio kushneri]OOE48714.1 hypothetical protein BZG10_10915 [Salinivibrio kushneri]OOE49271.1 hypothetical protein BZG11_12375 [Salinivibrio kushneri]OOE61192.1 hypothetical protein BZG18_08950 [Salinivibrio kushneri]